MKILIINSADTKGGASKVGYMLAKGLHEREHYVLYLVGKQFASDIFIEEISFINPGNARKFSQKVIHRLGINQLGLLNQFPFKLGKSFIQSFDLIHIHDLPSFNLLGFPWLTRLRPTVWTLHTLAPFTGNCLYPYSCDKWKRNCGQCPQFGKFPLTWLHRDASGLNLRAKRFIYGLSCLHIVGVSEWVSYQAKQSILGRFPIHTILNPVDTEIYHPLSQKAELRRKFGIPEEANVILFSVSGKVEDTRKGLDIILDALPKLKTTNIYLIPLGIAAAGSEVATKLTAYSHRPFEHIANPHKLNQLLNAADLLWHPSRADTSSLMSLEACAAGIAVIAADVGGVREIVKHGETGYLIPANDPEALAEKTDLFFSLPQEQRRKMGKQARQRVEVQFSLKQFLDNHESFYEEILKTGCRVVPVKN
ncbi:MAG: glycosyltransferase [Xenococcus sp. MO_188.B8]|nr:glycosyltransferase [Xenococcus sp. MO_188.B8]